MGFTTGSPLYYFLGSYCAITSILVFCGICHTLDNPRPIPDYIPEPLEYLNATEEYINTNTQEAIAGSAALGIGMFVWARIWLTPLRVLLPVTVLLVYLHVPMFLLVYYLPAPPQVQLHLIIVQHNKLHDGYASFALPIWLRVD